jgi:serine/threonine protein kinase/WD40 repeat protein
VKANEASKNVALTAPYKMKGAPRMKDAPKMKDASPRPRPVCVGRYELGDAVGTGGMGVVYRAHDPDLDRTLAIKVVHAGDASSGARLLREAKAMAQLRHPNVVPIFDVGPAEGAVFVAMPLLEGGTLRDWLDSDARTFGEILDRFIAAGRGLAAAHAAGLVHRDFKPENVLLGRGGETQVSDFGIVCLAGDETAPSTSASTLASDTLTKTGDILGTPAYMAPEQLRGRPSDARADQFSFCIALWEGIYGERPFAAQRSGLADPIRTRLDAIAAGPVLPAPRRDRPAWIAPVLARGLEIDPDRRWPTMDALLDAIAARRTPRRSPWRLAVAAGLTAIAVSITLAITLSSRTSPPSPSFSEVQLTYRGDLANAAISPDGTKLAIVAGDSLVLRGIAPDAEDRVLVEHGIEEKSISWSPDGKHLLVATISEVVNVLQTELVDVDDGPQYKFPPGEFSSFLSAGEIAVTSYRQRSVRIFALGVPAVPVATCDLRGDYTFIWGVAGMPDGTMIVETTKAEAHALTILGRDCRVRATFSAKPISGVALSDEGTVVTMVHGNGFDEILELSLDGAELSRRRINGKHEQVIGRRHGADYVLAQALETHLDRVHPMTPPVRQFSVNAHASFSIAPDGGTLAWIELDDRSRPRGPLRLSTLENLARRGHPLLDNAVSVSWSPDGQLLAALIDDGARNQLVIVDRSGRITSQLPLEHFDLTTQPVWLDAHHIAAQTDDHTTYGWFDLETRSQGEVLDRTHGSIWWLTRSPRDGTLAMWRTGKPNTIAPPSEYLWLMSPGREAAPLHLDAATRSYLLPSWSPSGELLVRALETGVVSRVDLTTGKLTPIAQLPAALQWSSRNDEHLLTLPGGDLLAVETEPGLNVSVVRTVDESPPRSPVGRSRDPL